jgi:hypothetical protein
MYKKRSRVKTAWTTQQAKQLIKARMRVKQQGKLVSQALRKHGLKATRRFFGNTIVEIYS